MPLLPPAQLDSFTRACRLNEVTNDPEDEPYRSKYKARAIFIELLKDLTVIRQNTRGIGPNGNITFEENNGNCDYESELDNTVIPLLIAALQLKLGINHAETDENQKGVEYLEQSLATLSGAKCEQDPRGISIHIGALNFLGFINAERGEFSKAKEYLERAEASFHIFLHSDVLSTDEGGVVSVENESKRAAIDVPSLFMIAAGLKCGDEESRASQALAFDKLHSYTLFYLAQVHRSLGHFEESAKYCQITLVRQLECGAYEPLEWAVNCATLSQYFLGDSEQGRANFPQARHCLVSADQISTMHESNIIKASTSKETTTGALVTPMPDVDAGDDDDPEIIGPRASLARAKADVARCWAKYGIALLETSKEKLLGLSPDCASTGAEGGTDKDLDCVETRFSHVLKPVDEDSVISAKMITTFEDARAVFLKSQSRLNAAKTVYTLDDHCTDYVEIVQDLVRLYHALMFFEPAHDRKCKMTKRRVDLLDEVVNQLNPTHYLLVCRQLLFELGETSKELLDLKLDSMNEKGAPSPTPQQIVKVNKIVYQSMDYFTRYLESYRDKEDKMPEMYPSDSVRQVLLAHFYLARLWNKLHTPDINDKLRFVQSSLQEYKWVVRYCDQKHAEAKEVFKSEYELALEMTTLLPIKMQRIRDLGDGT